VKHVLERYDVVVFQNSISSMQFEDSLGDDGLETAEVKFVFFEEGVYCAKYQEFAEDREGV
jgi:hypothetical protein